MIRVFYRTCGKSYPEQHTAAYDLLYAALRFCGYDPSLYELARTEGGKPYFKNDGSPCFSISHSGGVAVCTVGEEAHGVDIQENRDIPERVSRRYLGSLTGLAAVRRWTELESLGKLTGKGVFSKEEAENYRFFTFDEPDGYTLTVCSSGEEILPSLTLL